MREALTMDLYELTMAYSYFKRGLNGPATFDYFVRAPTEHRRFLIFAGLETLLDYLENLRFEPEDLAYLESLGLFDREFLEYLRGFRFRGEVWAVPEGEVVFPGEPLVRVSASRIEAQLIETFLLNALNFETLIASKAARVLLAAGLEASVVDFSPRRDHGVDAALKVARASYLAGFAGTSNVAAGRAFGIPVVGTMAHAYVMSFPDELSAFRAFAEDHPNPTLLIDTYDVLEGARNALRVAQELRARGRQLFGVRIDSGDLAALSRKVRRLLDEAGFPEVKLIVSGDLDEYRIQAFREQGGVAWGYGVGTRLGVSWDLPALGGVYKLVEDAHGPRIKKSAGKLTLPARKQVWRLEEGEGFRDVIGLEGEDLPGRPLLRKVMVDGRRLEPPADLRALRERVRARIFALPEPLRVIRLEEAPAYPVGYSARLEALVRRL
ncbi:nicotinate phosphoribosyltransferase [Marinithermus hydrothermalis]|uniref:Nicotinate phosphoribosyltransferase n=1 Tax=Marinithermus hydrothermalis (strain DSM 14884 / JCM 11576 / T1) TaxID=869210 RepID=F2NPX3_MARHT|nr:nicotinate phosphoribosyltransferase [Marinithermus hydrothermalis]AEB11074.1 nicotinate phosphoribosyltransferase [Marinithermus hydrothermalis DSM 14884]